ncbi:ectonucleoside triphosphate diphosphohydrolase 4 isoform X4 [Calypte anna]|uniref:ectonucleoside triphosphate diphosphohydrolase 4 isoform X4 n=1 Tax=Calypte anna TaxID=9244 RepID=UPI0011C447D3|nr:ectonucleoside triphosphate diphosphohydrolase 4 isoform X4 [Calypte anna]
MGRLSISCLLPASWHFSISPVGCPRVFHTTLRQVVVLGILAAAASLLCYSLLVIRSKYGRASRERRFQRYLSRVGDTEATDTSNPNLSYGIVVDCGSSGSRIFVYCWPRHNGNPHDLLDIQQMRDKNRKPVVMKIKPGISEFASSPEKVSDYISPLLSFAAEHVPRAKHKETPLYILCTAGMRILPESQQKAILEDLLTDIPVHFDFLFSDSHAEVISGKQEGVYAWIGINFVLGRFEHTDDEDEAIVEVHVPGSENREVILRKRTVGILDMGGVSTQIAYEVPKTVSFASSQQEEVAKNLLAEFNLGCDAHQTEHVYRVYVATFLGFGGNAARQRYEDSLFTSTVLKNRLLGTQTGLTWDSPYLDPCLPLDAEDEIQQKGQKLYLRGTGDFQLCREIIQPFMNKTNETQTSLNGVYQPAVHFQNSEFYGFSEFYYCTEDVLRMGGDYNAAKFTKAAKRHPARKLPWHSLPLEELLLCLQSLFVLCLFSGCAALHPALPPEAQKDPQANVKEQFLSFPLDGGGSSTTEDPRTFMRGCVGDLWLDLLPKKPFLPQGSSFFCPLKAWKEQIAKSMKPSWALETGKWGHLGLVSLDNISQKSLFSLMLHFDV